MLAGEIIGSVASGWGSGLGSTMILETRLTNWSSYFGCMWSLVQRWVRWLVGGHADILALGLPGCSSSLHSMGP